MLKGDHAVAVCPDCQSNITLPPAPELWMRITCPECGTQLEIVGDSPWELDYAEDIDDDDDVQEDEDTDYEDFEDAEDEALDDKRDSPWNT
jgi:lysine biosynthesis protein LysW